MLALPWLNDVLHVVLGLIAVLWLRLPTKPGSAGLLRHLADDAAAAVLAAKPGATWEEIVRDVIARLKAESTLPTGNLLKIEQAVVGALMRLGHRPPVPNA